MPSSPFTRGERIFRVLLHIYPRAFHQRYHAELIDTYRRDRARPRFSGVAGTVRFWRHTLGDLARTGVAARRRHAGDEGSAPSDAGAWSRGCVQDLGAAMRGLWHQPGYTALAVLTLGLGVGATTAVFAVVDGVLLAPLPYDQADRLVRVHELEHGNPGAQMVAYGNFADLRAQARGFKALAAWQGTGVTLTGRGSAQRLAARMTSANFADVFHESPTLGRWFTEEEAANNAAVAVLTHALWQDAFGADPGVVGRAILLDGRAVDVIGVMRPAFLYPGSTDLWLPLPPVRDTVGQRRWHRHSMVGRLAEGTSAEALATELAGIAARLEAAYPDYNKNNYFQATPLLDDMVGTRRQSLLVLFGAVSILLLIACVNVASLAMTRSMARAHEMAVRAALGASHWRLARLMLAESLLLGSAGAALAIGLAQLGVVQLLAMTADSVPRASTVSASSPRVLAFGIAASLLAALAVALPALLPRRASSANLALRGSRGAETHRVLRGRKALVVAQLAAAFILATGAGLLLRSVRQLQAVETGVAADDVLSFEIGLPATKYETPAAVSAFVGDVIARFEQRPQVVRAAATLTAPVDPYGWYNSLTIRDRDVPTPDLPHVSYVATSAGYFDALGIPVLAGRTYDAGEPRGQKVVVINQTAAERYWPDRNPIGQQILGSASDDSSWATIVGVVGDVRQALDQPVEPTTYIPIAQAEATDFVVMVRTSADAPTSLMPDLRAVLAGADRDVPITGVMTLPDRIALTTAAPTFSAVLMTTFASTALLLAAAGVFAMVSFSVAQRHREFGIRLAVGAGRPRIFREVLGTNLQLAAAGIGVGLVSVSVGSHALEGLLYGVEGADVTTLTGVAIVIVVVALGAGVWPARRAASADPLAALRAE